MLLSHKNARLSDRVLPNKASQVFEHDIVSGQARQRAQGVNWIKMSDICVTMLAKGQSKFHRITNENRYKNVKRKILGLLPDKIN